MYGHGGRNIGIGMTASEDDHSDKRSSTSSTGWMMKNPLRQPLVTQAREAPGQGIQLKIDTHAPTSKNDPITWVESGDASLTLLMRSETTLYLSLRELLNRLFGAIVSLEDETFIKAFFMTYRRFCTPSDVLREFLDRCVQVKDKSVAQDVRMWALQKWVLVLPEGLEVD